MGSKKLAAAVVLYTHALHFRPSLLDCAKKRTFEETD